MANQNSPKTAPAASRDTAGEIADLRRQVANLRARLATADDRSAVSHQQSAETNPWLKMAATVAITFALGRIISVLRLPTATAVAIPMITTEVNRRLL